MFKYYSLIVLLIVTDILGFKYLNFLDSQKHEYPLVINEKPYVFLKKDIKLYDTEDFVFDNYIYVICNKSYSYDYEFSDDVLEVNICVLDDSYSFTYEYSIIEKEVIKEIVYRDVYHESKPQSHAESVNGGNSGSSKPVSNNVPVPSSFTLIKSSLSYSIDTEIGRVLADLSSCFVSDCYVSVEYSELNTSVPGTYPINLYPASGGSYTVWVNIG